MVSLKQTIRQILKEELWDPTGQNRRDVNNSSQLVKQMLAKFGAEKILMGIAELMGRSDIDRYVQQASDNWGSAEVAVTALTKTLTPNKIKMLARYVS